MNCPPREFDFKTQQEVGDWGEGDFLKYYAALGPVKTGDRRPDFRLADGALVELKTDTYDMEKSPNCFMEAVSDTNTGAPGGPWRSKRDGIKSFVYYFIKNKTFIWYPTEDLVDHLDLIARSLRVACVHNPGYVSQGYVTPRSALAHLEIRHDTF